jgi:hypothetical protein
MVKYTQSGDRFIIDDFQHAKTFASFLPAVAGTDGKPLWAFYANVGQCMGGFGVTSRDTPITPFDSANLAYQNIKIKSFRTFLKINDVYVTPFFTSAPVEQQMSIGMADFSIKEEGEGYRMEITYSSVSHRNYPGLIRKVIYTNTSKEEKTFTGLDGLPIFFPLGLSNICYKELVSLMAAYCIVSGLKEATPFVKFKTSTGDNSVVKEAVDGNGFVAVDQNGKKLPCIVDPAMVFGDDLSILTAEPFEKQNYADFLAYEQQTENKLPCAFYSFSKKLKPGESYSVCVLYGSFENEERYRIAANAVTLSSVDAMIQETGALLQRLVNVASVHTGNPLFDKYVKQSYLDNNLRGGFPTLLNNADGGEVYYVYGRKHGDMERDYNSFQIPSRYYSSGAGNFRDVNQNRRSDLYFHPFVKDYNVKLFFSLIQVDGQNPLNVKPEAFHLNQGADLGFLEDLKPENKAYVSELIKAFEPSAMYTYIKDECGLKNGAVDALFAKILGACHQEIEANFAEGYWVDHWTYNVDLLENYSAVYPDKEKELFFGSKYGYFYSPVYVNPRSEKYCLLPDGKIRQYGAIDLKALKKECERRNLDIAKTYWLSDVKGQKVETNLAGKILNLIAIKFSTLDSLQLGIEMECEKPGWNDAMNGLPGLFSSGLSESVELLRLVNYAKIHLAPFKDETVPFLEEQVTLLKGLSEALAELKAGKLTSFAYWDKATSLREALRLTDKDHASGIYQNIAIKDILPLLDEFQEVLTSGLKKAREIGGGIIPSYLIYDVASYEMSDHVNFLGYPTVKATSFKLRTIPPFLEASARAMKLGQEVMSLKDYEAIKDSDLYDKKLHFYKTCAALDDAPFEIGRVHAFTKGWLERECNFLHMSYKYMLGLLKAGFYDQFFAEIKTNFVVFMSPEVYGRDPAEASSFVVPTCNPDKKQWGRGYFARLTGANAEFLNMLTILFLGEHLYSYEGGELCFHLDPKLSHDFFDEKGDASFLLFSTCDIVYHNPQHLNCYEGVKLVYVINGQKFQHIRGALAEAIRSGKVQRIDVEVSR